MIPIDIWQSEDSLVFLNPKLPQDVKNLLEDAIEKQDLKSVIWLQSSGTESAQKGFKMVCLEKKSILLAAKSVNTFFALTDKDTWLNPLPHFHIGGLSINARCFLSGAKEILMPNWQPLEFLEKIIKNHVTIASVVPTQIYDIVNKGLQAPQSLRILLLGGGSIGENLYKEALRLGWPVCPSYGMTETSAMVAGVNEVNFEKPEIPSLKILNHVQFIKWKSKFEIKSQGLFKGFLWVFKNAETLWDIRPTPFIIDDLLHINNNRLTVLGRESELVKILGETVNLNSLEEKINEIIGRRVAIVANPIDRKGFELKLYVEDEMLLFSLESLNKNLMPFERISEVIKVTRFPQTELGKIIKSKL
jgi:o-succinylbenzoate---CoA ligase